MSTDTPIPQTASDSDAESQLAAGETSNAIMLPRWLVYFQAAMLGIVATTFFIFGLMVGSLTSGTPTETIEKFDCRIAGVVEYLEDGEIFADEGAVVFLLPRSSKPQQRAAASSVSPDSFQSLDNPGIEIVHQFGGAIVRADQNGEFEVAADAAAGAGIDYFLLVVSRNKIEESAKPLSKQQVAGIGTWFLPVERVMNDRAIHWDTISLSTDQVELPAVRF